MSYYQDPNQPHHHHQQAYPPQQHHHQQQQAYPAHQQYNEAGYGAPPPPPPHPSHAPTTPSTHGGPIARDSGSFGAVQYLIKHRNTNSVLEVTIPAGEVIKSETGAMIHMSPSVTIQGKSKLSMRKMFTGDNIRESTYTGPGKVALAPTLLGDIVPLQTGGGQVWRVGMESYLASTSGVEKVAKSQGIRKGLFSGEDMFVYNMSGDGIVWLTSYGAIEPLHLAQGEQHIVDNGHLVAWNCEYQMERAGGGYTSGAKTGEGHVCRFTGPGIVYIQTRNLEEFGAWVRSQVPSN